VKSIAIHRGVLQQILVDTLKENSLRLNHKLKMISKEGNGFLLEFTNGEKIESNVLIGADGINSKVRESLFHNHTVRNANQICWRGITNYSLPKEYQNELNEAWGKKERFGFVKIAENKVYWYALKSFNKNEEEFHKDSIDTYFNDYHTIIKKVISSSDIDNVYTASITDLKPMHKWFDENVCLIGDAAHATTPNMGQGACQAIEDAYVLSMCLENYKTDEAFKVFQKNRLPKAHQIVSTSWRVGKISHISNPILIGIRNGIMKLTPASIQKKQLKSIFKLSSI